MSNNQGDKPQITQNEWILNESTNEIISSNDTSRNGGINIIAQFYKGFNDETKCEANANAKMTVLAANLTQKYGSLESLEQRMIEAEKKAAAISQLESENETLHKSFTEVCERVKELDGRIMTMRRLYEGIDYKQITKLENDLLILITQLLTPKQK